MVLFSRAESDHYFTLLQEALSNSKGDQLLEAIVNAPFSDRRKSALLGLGIIVLLMVNKSTGMIDRVTVSDTEFAKRATERSIRPLKDAKIPLSYKGNFIAEAIRSERYQQTSDWRYLLAPDFSPDEARLNQAGAGVACSFVYPLLSIRGGGALVFNYYLPLDKIESQHHDFMNAYSRLVASNLK